MWECIDFFRLGKRWMLMASQITEGDDAYEGHPQKLTEAYWIGDFDGRAWSDLYNYIRVIPLISTCCRILCLWCCYTTSTRVLLTRMLYRLAGRFTPLVHDDIGGRAVDYGFVAAAKTGGDLQNSVASGRRVFFGWNDVWTRYHAAAKYNNGDWKQFSQWGSVTQPFGSQILPRDFWLDAVDESTLRFAPVPELQTLRKRGLGNECHLSSNSSSSNIKDSMVANGAPMRDSNDWIECAGRQIELNATIRFRSASSAVDLIVLASTDGREATTIHINSTVLALDRRKSSLTPDANSSADPGVRNWFPQNRTILYAPLWDDPNRAFDINLRVYIDGRHVFPISSH